MAEARTDINAIARGEHQDPFSFLGMHADTAGSDLRVRAFVPGASRIEVVAPDRARPLAVLSSLHPEGVFAGTVKDCKRPCPYRLRVTRDGRDYEMEDCYRFGPALGELDLHLLTEGRHQRAYQKLGANFIELEGVSGIVFVVWAPNARRVSLVGDFNGWDGRCHPMRRHHDAGLWELFMPGLAAGAVYKYEILDRDGRLLPLKADPFARYSEAGPGTASVTWDSSAYHWNDGDWMATRGASAARRAPVSIYEVHLGSWKRADGDARYLGYRELAEQLVPYVADLGFTHIELLPVTEHPFDGSWGYQPIGLYAPTSRFGTPDEFRLFVDRCHQRGIGVIMDWVPAHFPDDPHGLVRFDGTALYEHEDPRKGRHQDWGTLIYNFGRREVANFLVSNALFWSEQYHIDGLRVDAVASMLYLDYSREPGDWTPNEYGGNENLEAVAFLQQLNELFYGLEEGVFTAAEESTAWPMVSRPVYLGGLGFGYKWNMGWMHDTLNYINHDPIHRRHHHDNLTFGLVYAFSENFILPLSHDEVVHGKGSLLARMPGDEWQKFANLRLYYAFMYAHPGKKLLFMGAEIAQLREWNHDLSLDWHLLDTPLHAGVQRLVRDLNMVYREAPSLHQLDCEPQGFAWIDGGDVENSVISFLRASGQDLQMIVICNFTPVVRRDYRIGVPASGVYLERLNTDASCYGGSDTGNGGRVETAPIPCHGHTHSLCLTLPPLGALYLELERRWDAREAM